KACSRYAGEKTEKGEARLKRSAGDKKSGRSAFEPVTLPPSEGRSENLPSRADILAFIAREREVSGGKGRAKIGKREIARAFKLKGEARIALKALLKEFEAEGAVARRGKNLHRPGLLPKVVVANIAR